MFIALTRVLALLATSSIVLGHSHDHDAQSHAEVDYSDDPWLSQFGPTADLSFSGVTTFAHLPHVKLLEEPAHPVDIALFGIPFDSAVSYRPGARFGPYALRAGEVVPYSS